MGSCWCRSGCPSCCSWTGELPVAAGAGWRPGCSSCTDGFMHSRLLSSIGVSSPAASRYFLLFIQQHNCCSTRPRVRVFFCRPLALVKESLAVWAWLAASPLFLFSADLAIDADSCLPSVACHVHGCREYPRKAEPDTFDPRRRRGASRDGAASTGCHQPRAFECVGCSSL